LTNHEYITSEFHESLKRSQLKGNEVLVTIAGTIGRAGVNTKVEDGNINQAIAILRLNKKMNPFFLSAFLNSDAGRIQFAKYRHDFGTPNINTTELAKLLVPLPPITIQEKVAEAVLDFEIKILKAKEACKESEKRKSEIITEFLIGTKKHKNVFERLK
jgi:restriction endonuclease S subunit